jgi:peptidylprolyl isomerase
VKLEGNDVAQAKTGDTVKVHYAGKLEDGAEFDSSVGRDPLEFTLGEGGLIPAFEQAVIGMAPGEKKTLAIPSEEAYGPHHAEMVQQVERSQMPDNLELDRGMQLQATRPGGEAVVLTVVEFTDEMVTVDANHPLAGKDLTFDIELVAIS